MMHAVRQKCRPKHQVLVLNCYPRHHKNNVEVKPNSSELSYLLYYASTRRSKLQKVGEFLDKRTTSDVWKGRIGNVQVTLQIVKALIEKTPKDLPLYAASVLRIFRTILLSKDLTMIEETVPTFEAFCIHQDPAQLAASQDFIRQYDEIVALYAAFASKDAPIEAKTKKSIPTLIRFRKVGLEAIKALSLAEILVVDTEKQLHAIIPPLLENIYSSHGSYLNSLEHREEEKSEVDKELALKRRQSISTVRTAETAEPDPVAASGTTEAADELAEQETAVIALQALKSIFSKAPRGQLRLVSAETLAWVGSRISPQDHFPSTTNSTLISGSWPCTLAALVCGWAPVQDRYVILITAMDTLIHSPILEKDFDKQYVIAVVIGWLLSSDINFIGLSVMDVLIGLIQHILLLLQLPANTNLSHTLRTESIDGAKDSSSQQASPSIMEPAQLASSARLRLIDQLQKCIGCLSIHIYYSDQVADMVSVLLARIKPASLVAIADTESAVETSGEPANALASSVNLAERSGNDGFFSFETARICALQSVKEIIAGANWTKRDGSVNNTVRNPIEIDRWEGTQWLLRDPSWKVRVAYVQALLTWARHELKKKNLRVPDDPLPKKSASKRENGARDGDLARRAVSNASRREISPKRKRATFLQLLHLAIYDSAIQHADSEPDILLLHLLLTELTGRLGVNAVQFGLPMIIRLQEDIQVVESPKAKINIGGLVHGYLWALSVHFSFDGASTGRDIQTEISRRLNHGTWLNFIRVPSLTIEQIEERANEQQVEPDNSKIQNQILKPYDNRVGMVEKISEGYSINLYSPPSSPPGSPARSLSQPMLAQSGRMPSFSAGKPPKNNSLPSKVKEAMLADWTRESVIAATTKSETSRSGSTHGSASPTTNTHQSRHLSVNSGVGNGSVVNGDGVPSPRKAHHYAHLHSSRPSSGAYGFVPQGYTQGSAMRDALNNAGRPQSRRSKRASQSPTPYSTTSSARSTVRVDELKRVLGGAPLQNPPSRGEEERAGGDDDESGTESMVSYDGSELSFIPSAAAARSSTAVNAADQPDTLTPVEELPRGDAVTEGSITPRPLTAVTAVTRRPSNENLRRKASVNSQQNDDIPPVPPLPPNLRSPTPNEGRSSSLVPDRTASVASKKAHSLRSMGSVREKDNRPRTSHSTAPSRKNRYSTMTTSSKVWNARDLLDDIDAEATGPLGTASRGVGVFGGKPPY